MHLHNHWEPLPLSHSSTLLRWSVAWWSQTPTPSPHSSFPPPLQCMSSTCIASVVPDSRVMAGHAQGFGPGIMWFPDNVELSSWTLHTMAASSCVFQTWWKKQLALVSYRSVWNHVSRYMLVKFQPELDVCSDFLIVLLYLSRYDKTATTAATMLMSSVVYLASTLCSCSDSLSLACIPTASNKSDCWCTLLNSDVC